MEVATTPAATLLTTLGLLANTTPTSVVTDEVTSSSVAAVDQHLAELFGNLSSNLENQTGTSTTREVNLTNNTTVVVYGRVTTAFAALCALVFIVVGVAGNFITIVALIQCKKLRSNATTMFVLALCISDLVFCAFNMPLTAVRYIYESWPFGDTLCQAFPFLFYGNVAVSLLCMVAITINRFILIMVPTIYDRVYRPLHVGAMIAAIYAIGFGMLLPPLVGAWGQFGLDEPTFSCTILKKNGSSPKKMLFIVGFGVPCIVITVVYTAIYWRVRKSRENVNMGANRRRKSREEWRLTRMMITIFLGFLSSFGPLMLVNVADDGIKWPPVHVLASILAWASAVINPFIYAFSNRQYRNAYEKFLRTYISARLMNACAAIRGRNSQATDQQGGGHQTTPSHTPTQSNRTITTECNQPHVMQMQRVSHHPAAAADSSSTSNDNNGSIAVTQTNKSKPTNNQGPVILSPENLTATFNAKTCSTNTLESTLSSSQEEPKELDTVQEEDHDNGMRIVAGFSIPVEDLDTDDDDEPTGESIEAQVHEWPVDEEIQQTAC